MNRVYILGAGASAQAGAPLGNDIIKKYIGFATISPIVA